VRNELLHLARIATEIWDRTFLRFVFLHAVEMGLEKRGLRDIHALQIAKILLDEVLERSWLGPPGIDHRLVIHCAVVEPVVIDLLQRVFELCICRLERIQVSFEIDALRH